jgi:hypothetical protein
MKRSLALFSSALALIAATAACGVERSSTVLGPTTSTSSTGTKSTGSMLGTWVVQGSTTPAAVTKTDVAGLPDFSTCSNLRWEVTTQTATQVAGNFAADCAAGVNVTGNITGQLGGATIPIVIAGTLTSNGGSCAFSLDGTGTPVDAQTFNIAYAGTTCLGPVQGTSRLSLAAHSAPTAFSVSGAITDGTSGGVLPNVEASSSGLAVRSDAAGHYLIPGVPAGPITVTFAAASYVTQTKSLTLSDNAVVDVVLQRVAPAPPPAPAPSGGNGDAIDLHSAIIRGGCCGDVADWPITTQIRVLDIQANGAFVDFDAKNRWPDAVPAGWSGGIQYTLWMVVNVNGRWVTAGGVEYWRGLARQGGPPSGYAGNWYYSPLIWGELASHQPSVGEQVGFFVTAGDQRAKDVRVVTERSNVVLVPFPSDGGGYYPF